MNKAVILILGDVDTGKSGITLYLANRLKLLGKRVAVVDTDIGQSDIGPPGTIGLSLVEKPVTSYSDLPLTDAFFVGDKTPIGHLLPMIVGTKAMVERAFEIGAEIVLVNTTGMIYGGPAFALKTYKIGVVKPNLILALERENELEHIIKPFEKMFRIRKLSVPSCIRRKKRTERLGFRRLKFTQFLTGMRQIRLNLDKITLINTMINCDSVDPQLKGLIREMIGRVPSRLIVNGPNIILVFDEVIDSNSHKIIRNNFKGRFQEIKIICTPRLRGLLLGLYNSEKRFLGIGILESLEIGKRSIRIKSAVRDHENIRYVALGFLFLNENGEEAGRVKPGVLFV